ncbi:MAG: hypothetical protein UZ20_WS6002001028 [candidate division WS6 bacterium OLB21]|uniref:Uncharacterized protein n=1 Tax=candidate division WS6 bacterium OLB21 TaxID=1617427 RepID=A0A136KEZ4_9BACT|nr:MAG: hypothetical protein UZ20_WS6002001028 [candidate division WS6 bacterium OLB21]
MKTALNNKLLIIVLALFVLSLVPKQALAQNSTRDTVEFKNRIVNQNGQAIKDGTYNMKFILFDNSSGGNELWSEERSVPTRRGNFSVNLGSINPFPKASLANVSDLFLHICLDANGQDNDGGGICATRYEENFRSRKRITSVPWSLRSFALGPVSINDGGTGFPINVTSGNGTIVNFQYQDLTRLSVGTNGLVTMSDGSTNFIFNPAEQRVTLSSGADIFFGTKSIKSTTAGLSGASIVGVNQANFTNISGADVQAVLDSIDDLIGTGGGIQNETDPIWIAARNSSSQTITPNWNFSSPVGLNQGAVFGNNAGTTAGTIRYTGSDFEGYTGGNWVSLTSGSIAETDPIWIAARNSSSQTITPAWTFSAPLDLTQGAVFGNNAGTTAGTIRYTGSDFEGYTGGNWVSLTTAPVSETDPVWVDNRDTNPTTITPEWTFSDTINTADILPTTDATSSLGSQGSRYNQGLFSEFIGIGTTTNYVAGKSLLQLDSSEEIQPTSGDYDLINGRTVYDAQGTTGSEQINLINIRTDIAEGDGSNINRARGVRSTILNNNDGQMNGVFNFSSSVRNEKTVTGSFYSFTGFTENVGTVNGFISNMGSTVVNSGTANNLRGNEIAINNSGSANAVNGAINFLTNTGTVSGGFTSYSSNILNNGTVNTMHGLFSFITNNNEVAGRLSSIYYNLQNNGTYSNVDSGFSSYIFGNNTSGTIPQWYGYTIDQTNAGTALGSIRGLNNVVVNASTGTIADALDTVINIFRNDGNIEGTSSGIKNIVAAGTINNGGIYGIDNNIGSLQILETVPTSVEFVYGLSNRVEGSGAQEIYSNDYISGIYNQLNGDVSAVNRIIGIENEITTTGTANEYYGIWNDVQPLAPSSDIIGMYSTNGISYTYLNYEGTSGDNYSIFGERAYFTSIDIDNSLNRISTSPGPAAVADLYYGDDLLCDVSLPNCGMGGGGGGQWDDDGFDNIYYQSGNVAIGTSSFDATFNVSGESAVLGGFVIGSLTPSSSYGQLTIDRSFDQGNGAHISFVNSFHTGDPVYYDEGDLWYNSNTQNLRFYDGNSIINLGSGGGGGQWEESGSDIYYDDGYVAIGTSSFTEPFTAFGGSSFEGGSLYWYGSAPYEGMVLDYWNNSISLGNYVGDYDIYLQGNVSIISSDYFDVQSQQSISFGEIIYDRAGGTIQFGVDWTANGQPLSYFQNTITIENTYDYSSANLMIENGFICVDDGSASCPASTPGTVYAQFAYDEFDVAENILARLDVNPAEIVTFDPNKSEAVMKSSEAYQEGLLGVISTEPGVLGGIKLQAVDNYKVMPISLAGRVPVKVNLEGGKIRIGDPITSSSIPGVGMKATSPGRIIGYALDDFNQSEGTIVVYISNSYYMPKGFSQGKSGLEGDSATLKSGSDSITIYNANINSKSLINITPTSSTSGQVLYVASKGEGFFTVRIDSRISKDISFDYLIK